MNMRNGKVQFVVVSVILIAVGVLLISSMTHAKPKSMPWQEPQEQRDGYSRSFVVDAKILEIPDSIVETALQHTIEEQRLILYNLDRDRSLVYLASLDYAEKKLSESLASLHEYLPIISHNRYCAFQKKTRDRFCFSPAQEKTH